MVEDKERGDDISLEEHRDKVETLALELSDDSYFINFFEEAKAEEEGKIKVIQKLRSIIENPEDPKYGETRSYREKIEKIPTQPVPEAKETIRQRIVDPSSRGNSLLLIKKLVAFARF